MRSANSGRIVVMIILVLAATSLDAVDQAGSKAARSLAAKYIGEGVALGEKGDMPGAIPYFRRAAEADPTMHEAHANLGLCLAMVGDMDGARVALERAVVTNPTGMGAWLNLGNVYKALDADHRLMTPCYLTALNLQPNSVDALSNLAGLANKERRYELGQRYATRALQADNSADEPIVALMVAMRHTCDWYHPLADGPRLFRVMERAMHSDTEEHQMFWGGTSALYIDLPPGMNRLAAEIFAKRIVHKLEPLPGPMQPYNTALLPRQRYRLGYLGQDFGTHPMSQMMQGMFGLHNRDRVEVLCFATNADDGGVLRTKISNACDEFIELEKLSDSDAALVVNSRQLHVMVNLFGFLDRERNGIAAHNPAPVQINHRWCSTTGSKYTHWHVSDRVASPPEFYDHYTEPFAYMPNSYLPNDHQLSYAKLKASSQSNVVGDFNLSDNDDENAAVDDLPVDIDLGVGEDELVLASLNNVYKIEERLFGVWMAVLRDSPRSVLWLMEGFLRTNSTQRLKMHAQRHGVDPSRVRCLEFASKGAHIRRNARADLYLDTWFINGHSTAVDSLWAGVPLVTLARERMASRVAASLVSAMGVPQFVARTPSDYMAITTQLSREGRRGRNLRRWQQTVLDQLNGNGNVGVKDHLFDSVRFVKDCETVHRLSWELHRLGYGANFVARPQIIVARN